VPVSNKILISLIAVIALFTVFAALAYAGLFDPAAGFHNHSVEAVNREIELDVRTVQDFLRELQGRFAATLGEPAVQRSFLPNRSAEDISARSHLYGSLLEAQSGLQSVRFIDQGGGRIHYSTDSQDILSQKGGFISYRTYNSGMDEIAFENLAVPGGGEPRIIPDEKRERLIFSMAFYDSFDVYRGTALFALSLEAVSEKLAGAGRIEAGEHVSMLQSPGGIILGLPGGGDALIPVIASIWRLQLLNLTPLEPGNAAVPAIISSRMDQGIYVGRLVDGALVSFSRSVWILPAAFFCTIYLTIFLIFNFRQDTMTIIKSRIKSLQTALIEEYHNRTDLMDWGRWSRELERRREEVRRKIKRGIKGRRRKRFDAEIDICINTAWTELSAIIKSGTEPPVPAFNEVQIEEIVKRILRTSGVTPTFGGQTFMGNQAHLETVTGTQVLRDRGSDLSGRRLLAVTRNPAGGPAGDITTAEYGELASGKEKKAVIKDDMYQTGKTEKGEVPEEVGELEELEEFEELEELGEMAEESKNSGLPREDIAVLAREIEFTPLPEDETGSAGGSPLSDLEIVSPFITMLSDLNSEPAASGDEGGSRDPEDMPENKEKSPGPPAKAAPVKTSKLEILDRNYQMSLVYRPFTLENVPPLDLSPAEPAIISRNGVNYINAAALDEEDIPLDKDFQRLVNAVLR
jgi:hypothetical protein